MKHKMLLLALLASPILAAPPAVVNGTVQSLPSLAQAPRDGWIGYSMEATEPLFVSCCDDSWMGSRCDRCRLDSNHGVSINRRDRDDVGPVGDKTVLVMARLRGGTVDRVHVYSPQCTIDAAGSAIGWIENVPASASINFLRKIAESGSSKATDTSMLALSLHAGATDALIDIAKHDASSRTRGKALFWLSQKAGQKAASALRAAVDNDPEAEVRSKAVFGISQLPNDESIPLLIDLMKNHRYREVRKKAAFWLGQKNDPRALQAIEDILKN